MQLYPGVADMLSRKKDDGRADALLIATYGRRQENETEEETVMKKSHARTGA
jgi:hypothetical protein